MERRAGRNNTYTHIHTFIRTCPYPHFPPKAKPKPARNHPTYLLCIPIPPRPLPEHILLNLARARLGQLAHHLELARHHEAAQGAVVTRPLEEGGRERRNIRRGRRRSFFDGDKRLGALAPVRVGDGYDAYFEDRGVC
jgi:hypothetical protein